jgi:hypothetical protein
MGEHDKRAGGKENRWRFLADLKISRSAGILPAFAAAIPPTLRAGCPRSRKFHGFRVPVSRRASATAMKLREAPWSALASATAFFLPKGRRQFRFASAPHSKALGMTPFVRRVLSIAAAGVLALTVAASSRAESADVQPAALSKQRAALYLEATRAPLTNLESDVNHLAILSETCRVKYGSQACGLPEKPLESDKLEERYAYYVRQPVEAHTKVQGVKIDRRNWQGSGAR